MKERKRRKREIRKILLTKFTLPGSNLSTPFNRKYPAMSMFTFSLKPIAVRFLVFIIQPN